MRPPREPVTAPKRRTRKDADTSVGAAMVQSPPTAPKRRAHGNASTSASATVAGVPITHPDRVCADAGGVTKLELAQYYAALGERFVGEVRGRPLVLVRCPGGDFGQCFSRHASAGLDVELRSAAPPRTSSCCRRCLRP
jgi:bifunctional non-homologous end joining protein LigD